MPVQPFTIHIPPATLADLHQRLVTTRWPDQVADAAWDYGTNLPYLQHLVTYWRDRFDWRAQEAALNRFAHFRADVDGFGLGGALQHLLIGLLTGLVFGAAMLALVAQSAPRPLGADAFVVRGVNELLFPIGCALVVYAATVLGRRARG